MWFLLKSLLIYYLIITNIFLIRSHLIFIKYKWMVTIKFVRRQLLIYQYHCRVYHVEYKGNPFENLNWLAKFNVLNSMGFISVLQRDTNDCKLLKVVDCIFDIKFFDTSVTISLFLLNTNGQIFKKISRVRYVRSISYCWSSLVYIS